jgi:uncharacterized Zn-finger protein
MRGVESILAGAGSIGVLGFIIAICIVATFFMIYNDIHKILKLLTNTLVKPEVISPSAPAGKTTCPYCGAIYESTETTCPNCGKV